MKINMSLDLGPLLVARFCSICIFQEYCELSKKDFMLNLWRYKNWWQERHSIYVFQED